ncbi:SPOR domain-containing protein [Magnetococcales bacterium HHB-1]
MSKIFDQLHKAARSQKTRQKSVVSKETHASKFHTFVSTLSLPIHKLSSICQKNPLLSRTLQIAGILVGIFGVAWLGYGAGNLMWSSKPPHIHITETIPPRPVAVRIVKPAPDKTEPAKEPPPTLLAALAPTLESEQHPKQKTVLNQNASLSTVTSSAILTKQNSQAQITKPQSQSESIKDNTPLSSEKKALITVTEKKQTSPIPQTTKPATRPKYPDLIRPLAKKRATPRSKNFFYPNKKRIKKVPKATSYALLLGAYGNPNNAYRLQKNLQERGIKANLYSTKQRGLQMIRVQLGPFNTHQNASLMRSHIQKFTGIEGRVVPNTTLPKNMQSIPHQSLQKRRSTPPGFPALAAGPYHLLVGSFSNPKNAQEVRNKLSRHGYPNLRQSVLIGQKLFFRVVVGPFPQRSHVESARQSIETRTGLRTQIMVANSII